MSTETGTSLQLTRIIEADREAVFRAWTEPAQLKRWACPEYATVEDARVELRVGGKYRIRMVGNEGQVYTAFGVYREVEPPRRLVYTWDWEEKEHAVGATIVTVEFNARSGATEIVLTHEGFPSAEATDAHREGWTSCLNRFARLFAASPTA